MAIIGKDTFTDTNGTLLENHTPDIGTGWTVNLTGQSDIQGNRLRGSSFENIVYARHSNDIGDDDMDVQAALSVGGNNQRLAQVLGRIPSGQNGSSNSYVARKQFITGSQADHTLRKRVSSSETTLGTWSSATLGDETTKLEIRAAAKKVFVNGTERISSTDDSLVGNTFAGVGGQRDTGQIDNWQSESVEAAEGPNTFAQRQPREDWLLRTHRVTEHLVGA